MTNIASSGWIESRSAKGGVWTQHRGYVPARGHQLSGLVTDDDEGSARGRIDTLIFVAATGEPASTQPAQKTGQTRSSFTIVDVRVGISEEDENRVFVELGATDSSRRCGNKLISLTVEFEQTNLGHTVVALPLVERDLRHRDVDERSLKGWNPKQIIVRVGAEDACEGFDPQAR